MISRNIAVKDLLREFCYTPVYANGFDSIVSDFRVYSFRDNAFTRIHTVYSGLSSLQNGRKGPLACLYSGVGSVILSHKTIANLKALQRVALLSLHKPY